MDHLGIVKRLCDNNCDTYVVGGGIRDMLMGNEPEDFDIVTEATPDQVMHLFKDRKVKQVGKSFGVIIVDGYEVATFRFDRYKNKKCIVSFANTIREDLGRRDLTINAMAYCELTGELIDEHGGQEDLHNRLIKFVRDPEERIEEDPVRIIRACRFASKIDGLFETNTLLALGKFSKYVKTEIAPERIRIEVLKAMKTKKASRFFECLHNIGALKYIFPSLDACWDHEHGNHHEENIFEHCMLAGDHIRTNDPMLKLIGYLHDVGKPPAYDEKKRFLKHEVIGAELIRYELLKLKFSLEEVNRAWGLIRSHMYAIQRLKPKSIRKLNKKFSDRGVDHQDFMRLRMADRNANVARPNFTLDEYVDMWKRLTNPEVKEIVTNTHSLVYKGSDIIIDNDLVPGPLVGEIQKHLLEIVIENGKEYNTKEFLSKETQKYLERRNEHCR